LLALPLCAATWADTLATVKVPRGEISLLTEACGTPDSRIQQAVKRSGGERTAGCWSVNARGNPVIVWGDGRVQELAESRVRLAPKYAAMLDDEPAPGATHAAGRATTTRGTEAPTIADSGGGSAAVSPVGGASDDFPRPSWCKDARFPHEKLVCRDSELAAADLALAPLWRSYRDELKLTVVQQGRVKSEYFRRLKACGTSKPCIQRAQAAQASFYRQSLAER